MMKRLNQIGVVLVLALIGCPLGKAQETGDSIVQLTAENQGLQAVTPDQLPPFGTFWLVMPGANGCSAAPLPCPPTGTAPIFQVTSDQFLVDCTIGETVTESVLAAQAASVVNLINQIEGVETGQPMMRAMGSPAIPGPYGGGGDGTNGYGSYTNSDPGYNFDTNQLWLEIITVTNQTASLVIHPPLNVTNEVYDLLYCTNLAPPTSWQWLLRSYPNRTNLLVPNAADAQGFYRLATAYDPVANSSLGTNFWLAYYYMYDDSVNTLSLAITSPTGAAGTVVTPGLLMNGPIVIVTNCGDAVVNGTYVLTDLTVQEQEAWGDNGINSDSPSYVNGTNWVIADDGNATCLMIEYDTNTDDLTFLYEKYGDDNLNGSTNDWMSAGDTNATPATFCAQIPQLNQPFTVAAGAVTNIAIPLSAMMTSSGDSDEVETNGINVIASAPVAVYALDYYPAASAAFTGYPTTMLGTNYCIMARPAWADTSESQLAILATEDNTTVTIMPSASADLLPTNADLSVSPGTNAYQVNLLAGEVYQSRGIYSGDDVTGTWIASDKPIAVFAGDNQTYVPDVSTLSGNPLVQEQLPVESWGQEVLALSFAGRINGDSYRVLAAYDNTVITITGKVVTITNESPPPWTVTTSNEVVVVTNQAGQPYDIIVDGPVEFQASQPIQVAQFANGCYSDYIVSNQNSGPEGDPCEILLPPVGHYLNTNIVVTLPNDGVSGDFDENYINLIVAQSAITNTLVDGLPVAFTNFVAIGPGGFFGAQLAITNAGVHTVTSTQPTGVEVYGFGPAEAYGYFGSAVK